MTITGMPYFRTYGTILLYFVAYFVVHLAHFK
jgi:hypothetical protein